MPEPRSARKKFATKDPDEEQLHPHIELVLSGLFAGLADSLRESDGRSYGKFQVSFVEVLGMMVASGTIALSDAPKLLLDLEKLKAQDSSGGKLSKGDLLRNLTLETVAK